MSKFTTSMMIGGVVLSALSANAQAAITVLDKNPQSNSLLAPLSLTVGGSIRPEWSFNNNGKGDARKGHDGGSRFKFGADYKLDDHTSFIGYYELGVNMAHLLGMDGRYPEGSNIKNKRQLYAGVKDDRFGTLTYGQQYGVYYSVIGIKSDVWDNDGLASGDSMGINPSYDGGGRAKNSIKYTNDFGPVTLTANYLLPQSEVSDGEGFNYRRTNGGGVGLDYKITKDLTLSGAYSETDAYIKDSTNNAKEYHQQLSGTALTWTPNNWYLVTTASYYKDFIPSQHTTLSRYFAGSGYGLEAFGGYTFNIDKPYLKSIQPYVAVDSLQLKGQDDYHANHTYVGVGTTIGYGLSVYVERTFATTSDKQPDQTFVTVFYDF